MCSSRRVVTAFQPKQKNFGPQSACYAVESMSFDPGSLMLSILVSGIGFVIFKYGRSQQRVPQVATGILLMVYPYFVTSVAAMGAIAVLIIAAMWGAIYLGL